MRPDLTRMTYEARQRERHRKGMPPLPPLADLPPLEPIGTQHPPPPSQPIPTPLRFPEQEAWENLMTSLLPLAHVYQWCAEWQPDDWRKVSVMENQCKLAAENDHPKEYAHLKDMYLRMVGQIVEDYFLKILRYQYLEFASLSLLKNVRVCARTTEPIEEGFVYFYAREIPRLLCATPAEIEEFHTLKETFPGSLIV